MVRLPLATLTRPSRSRIRNASRSGVRLTPSFSASSVWSSAVPGGSSWSRISCRRCEMTSSTSRLRPTDRRSISPSTTVSRSLKTALRSWRSRPGPRTGRGPAPRGRRSTSSIPSFWPLFEVLLEGVGARVEGGVDPAEAARFPAGLLALGVQRGQRRRSIWSGGSIQLLQPSPRVAARRRAAVALAADDDRRAGALDRLGQLHRAGEGDELAVVGGDLVRPQAGHRLDVVVAAGAAALVRNADGGELLGRPAEADPEVDAAAGEMVEGRRPPWPAGPGCARAG